MRPVNRGHAPKDGEGNAIVFAEYNDARDSLIGRIGDYCSYCEVCLHSTIAVEHVRPKKRRPAFERTWTNFLLACVNCNAIKGDLDVDLNHYFWPDRDNTALVFNYDLDAPPRIVETLSPELREIAGRTIELTGLDRLPGHPEYSARDRRWIKRREAWGVALRARSDLVQNDTSQMRESILLTAVSRGFWSVWFQVFHDDVEMRSRLIQWFPGTANHCFDHETRPTSRAGGLV